MRPKDLRRPFSWNQRHVLLQNGVFFVPDYYNDYSAFDFPAWKSPELFEKQQPVHIEYCSGNGQWICKKALTHPHLNWVAVEKCFQRCQKIWSKIQNNGLKNILVVCGEGLNTTKNYFPPSTVEHIYINFPDPWPKKRHAKHRIINKSFIEQCFRILKEGGK